MLTKIVNNIIKISGIILILLGSVLVYNAFFPKQLKCKHKKDYIISNSFSIHLGWDCEEIKNEK